jgi:hypothetical protein
VASAAVESRAQKSAPRSHVSPRFDWIALARPEPAAGRRLSMAHRELPPDSVPFVMTRAIKSALRAYGYIDEQVAQLTPQEAHKILMGKGARPSCPLRSTFGGLRPSHGWGGTIAPAGIATGRLLYRNCISVLSAGPRHRPESHA